MKNKEVEFWNLLEESIDSEESIDLLPICRKNPKVLNGLMDQAIEWDLGYAVFHGGFQGLMGIGLQLADEGAVLDLCLTDIEPPTYEYDMVVFKYGEKYVHPRQLLKHLAIILNSDCSNCCDALNYIKVSKHGLVSAGNVSHTYHS